MPRCQNKVKVFSDYGCGFGVREIELDCTSTGPRGELVLCSECEKAGRRKPIEARSKEINAWLRSANWGEA